MMPKLTKQEFVSRLYFILFSSIAAFGAYFCMYAFRKPFTVARFDEFDFFDMDYKIALILLQVIGYAISKFIGIKIISELSPNKRKFFFLTLILMAQLALLLFALTPPPYNAIFMLFNGLPLGMIWGIVFSYLEGRKTTEILGVILCSSFIVSSGVVKSAGLWVMETCKVSNLWMPFTVGAIFLPVLILFIFFLEKIPAPNSGDIMEKSKRLPMTTSDRKKVFRKFAFPHTALIIFYTLLTAMRDFRDNFSRELWDSIGFQGEVSVYSTSEIIVSVFVLLIFGSIFFIKSNKNALYTYHYILVLGVIAMAGSTYLFQNDVISGFTWMIVSGFGLYTCYVPFNALFFDRFIAAFEIKGNAGFLIYMADAFGYFGSVVVLLYRNFNVTTISWLEFYTNSVYVLYIIALLSILYSYVFLKQKFELWQYSIEKEKSWNANLM